ncbi:MAG: alpha-L-arabinofuranosidase C-terminal domain-containing protein, partial [Anaerolineae bacterium]
MLRRYLLITLALLMAGLAPATLPTAGSALADQATITVDASAVVGTIRSLQGINAGPRGRDGPPHLFRQFEDIGVDYVRTHDYYGPADMRVIFPDLQADPDEPASYDFVSTDRELEAIKRVGAEVLFRLGESWGSPVTYVAPEDREAWAQAAVHVVRHYNDGWANGFHWGIEYWEIWNEPDIPFWTGTPEEYYELYEAVARALKAYDPGLKVGGPGLCCQDTFFVDFLAYCRDHDVPLDFVSWHRYAGGSAPYTLLQRAEQVQRALDFYDFTQAENLLTEWNISVEGDYEHLRDAAGAAWTASALTYLQDSTVTIANRYRGDGGLGMFTAEGLYTKPAYTFLAFRWMMETPERLSATGSDTSGYAVLAGRTDDGQTVQVLISDYNSSHAGFDLTVTNLPWGADQPYRFERYVLDETHNLTLVESADVPAGTDTFATSESMTAPSVQLIRLFVPGGEPLPRIEIDADQITDAIDPLLYGLNHRYLFSGYGVWDAEAQQVHPEVISRSLEIGFPVARFPGGTVGTTYHWTDGIGPPEERPTGISGFNGAPATNEYGFDEHMLFMEQACAECRSVGATANVVVNFATGTAQEAAAWVAYANGAVTDTTPIGVDEMGVDWGTVGQWAAQREANQARLGMTPHAYDIEYWEVGNELYGDWEYSWTHNPLRYAAGGTAWQYDQRVVKAGDWQDRASRSDGRPSQVFYVRYPPVVTGTQTITVAGQVWTEVPDLSAAGPDDSVYEFDPQQGEIRFGDGEHGRIPPLAALILASYESGPHDGFVDYYVAMKAVDPDIKVGSCMHSDAFLIAMGEDYAYDFLAVHPYYGSGDRDGDLGQAHLRTMAGPLIKQMDLEDLEAAVRLYAGHRADDIEIAITEYNLFVPERITPTPHYGMSLDQGLFVADMLRVMIEQGVPLGSLHALIDIYTGEGWGNPPVLSPYPQLIPRPGAYVLQLYSQHFAPLQVDSRVEDAPLLTGSVPALEVVASTDEAGDRLTLLAINKETTATITATIAISGFTPVSEATVWTLNGPDITAFNDAGHPTEVITTESAIADAGEEFTYTFPAHSVTLIELHAAPPASRCVGDANSNGIGDVVDIMSTAAEPGCVVYLPLVAGNWR